MSDHAAKLLRTAQLSACRQRVAQLESLVELTKPLYAAVRHYLSVVTTEPGGDLDAWVARADDALAYVHAAMQAIDDEEATP